MANQERARLTVNDLFNELTRYTCRWVMKYRYTHNIQPATLTLLEGIKNLVDPQRLMNPKSLGLE